MCAIWCIQQRDTCMCVHIAMCTHCCSAVHIQHAADNSMVASAARLRTICVIKHWSSICFQARCMSQVRHLSRTLQAGRKGCTCRLDHMNDPTPPALRVHTCTKPSQAPSRFACCPTHVNQAVPMFWVVLRLTRDSRMTVLDPTASLGLQRARQSTGAYCWLPSALVVRRGWLRSRQV